MFENVKFRKKKECVDVCCVFSELSSVWRHFSMQYFWLIQITELEIFSGEMSDSVNFLECGGLVHHYERLDEAWTHCICYLYFFILYGIWYYMEYGV